MDRSKEVREFFKQREEGDRVVNAVRDYVDNARERCAREHNGPTEDEIVETLVASETFWDRLRETVEEAVGTCKRKP